MTNIFGSVDTTTLALPNIVDTPTFETIRGELLASLQSIEPQYTLLLESDPGVKVLEVFAYREMYLRKRMNDGFKQNLLAFATGSNLDHLAAFYGVARLVLQEGDPDALPVVPTVYENDDAFRARIQLRVMSISKGGTAEHYRFWAMSADGRVKDASVWSPDSDNGYNMGGQVIVSIISSEGDGTPTDDVLQAVKDTLFREDVRLVTDILTVEGATPKHVTIAANVRLLPGTPFSVFETLQAKLQAALAKSVQLGQDITESWIMAQLQVPGVHSVSVTSPVGDVVVRPNEFPKIDSTTVLFSGFSDDDRPSISDAELARTQRKVYEVYVAFCKQSLRTAAQIAADLDEANQTGVIKPTVRGLAEYLAIVNVKDETGAWLREAELAFLIHRKLVATIYYAS